jgi:hypothetical protein
MIDDPYHYETFRTYYISPAAIGITILVIALVAAVVAYFISRAKRGKD